MAMRDRKTLKLGVSRWPEEPESEAEVFFTASPRLSMVEMLLVWGPGKRQQRSYALQEPDLEELHEWLAAVLGREE